MKVLCSCSHDYENHDQTDPLDDNMPCKKCQCKKWTPETDPRSEEQFEADLEEEIWDGMFQESKEIQY